MVKCKDCKYWDRESDKYVIPQARICLHPKVIDISELSASEIEFIPDGVYYSDYEEFKAILTTGPEFGCILGEECEKT